MQRVGAQADSRDVRQFTEVHTNNYQQNVNVTLLTITAYTLIRLSVFVDRATLGYARAVWPVSVCLSVTSRYCIRTANRIRLVFGIEATVGPSYKMLEGYSGTS